MQTLTLQQEGAALSGKANLTIYGVDCDFTGTAGPNNVVEDVTVFAAAYSDPGDSHYLFERCSSAPALRLCGN